MQRPCDERTCVATGYLRKSRMYVVSGAQQRRESMLENMLERLMGPGWPGDCRPHESHLSL